MTVATPVRNAPIRTAGGRPAAQSQPIDATLRLDEIELAGWTSGLAPLGGCFHEWLPLSSGGALIAVGCTTANPGHDADDALLLARAVRDWLRDHSAHARDADRLLAQLNHSVAVEFKGAAQAELIVALVSPVGGEVSLAVAGHPLAIRIRAAESQCLKAHEAPIATRLHHRYGAQRLELRPRERLALLVGLPESTTAWAIRNRFTGLTAETHRHMTAGDALERVRSCCRARSPSGELPGSSMVVVRRR